MLSVKRDLLRRKRCLRGTPPIEEVIVVAGPSCIGKTTFLKRFREAQFDDIEKQLSVNEPSSWPSFDAYFVGKKYRLEANIHGERHAFLQWTIPTPHLKLQLRSMLLLGSYDRPERIALLNSATKLTVLTLVASRERMITRVEGRINRIREKHAGNVAKIERCQKQLDKLQALYKRPDVLTGMYKGWFKFCETLDVDRSCLIRYDDEPILIPFEHWGEVASEIA